MLAFLMAACAACSGPEPATGHPPAAANRASVAGTVTAPATGTPPPPAPAAPTRHGRGDRHRRAHLAAAPVPYGVTCQPTALRLAQGPGMSEATQQETLILTLTNISATGCDLRGYPGVSLLTGAGRLLPFRIRWGGDQMLTTAAPVLVPLAPGATAYLAMNKDACAGHSYRGAHIFEVIPPNDYQPLTFAKPRYPVLDYCRASDPGHTVDVSPVEPSLRDILNQRITGG